jgi:hypothetical protein
MHDTPTAMLVRVASLLVALGALGCHSPGLYGYSRTYSPLSEEDDAADGAEEYDPIMAERMQDAWRNKTVSVFGVVESRKAGSGGKVDLKLSMRTLAPQNLCDEGGEPTCRVTVSEREHAVVHALVALRKEDNVGEHSVGSGSLVRVIGTLADGVDAADGSVVFQAKYYRHWPRNFYVTTAASSYMRR